MKDNYKVCQYSPSTGESVIVKQNKYGEFKGVVTCHPDDEDIKNQWDGLLFADYKCDTLAQQEKAKRLRERAKGAAILIQDLGNTPGISSEAYTKMEKHVKSMERIAAQEYQKFLDMRDSYKDVVNSTLKGRREIRAKIEKIKAKEK